MGATMDLSNNRSGYSTIPVTNAFPSLSSIELQKPQNPTVPSADEDFDDLPLIGPPATADAHGSDISGAVFNLATSIIGAGIMALPATMKVLGVAVGSFFIVVMGLLSEISIELLIRCSPSSSSSSNSSSYGSVVESALGRPAKILSEICIVVNNAGILIVYLIIIGDVMSGSPEHAGVFQQLIGRDGPWDQRRLVIFLTVVLFLAPLCSLEKIDSLSLTSAASVALAVVFVVVSSAIAAVKFAEGRSMAVRWAPDFRSKAAVLDLLVVIPIMTNAYVCHFNVHPIYNELRERSPQKMNRVGRVTTVLCVAVYASTSVSGYLLFGDETESDVLTNFDRDLGIRYSSALNYVVRIGYVLHLILVFPVIHFSLRETVASAVLKIDLSSYSSSPAKRKKVMLGLTAVLLGMIYLGSTMIPNIWVAFKFTGATAGLALGFIFPTLVALKLNERAEGKATLRRAEVVISKAILVFAVLASIIGVIGNVYGIRNRLS